MHSAYTKQNHYTIATDLHKIQDIVHCARFISHVDIGAKCLPVMLALCSMFMPSYYAQKPVYQNHQKRSKIKNHLKNHQKDDD